MEEENPVFEVIITKTAEIHFYEIVEYLYEYFSAEKAEAIAIALQEKALSLARYYYRGQTESQLAQRPHTYRYILFERTKRSQVKIIYYVDETAQRVYITDFFPTERDDRLISERSS